MSGDGCGRAPSSETRAPSTADETITRVLGFSAATFGAGGEATPSGASFAAMGSSSARASTAMPRNFPVDTLPRYAW